MLICYDKARQDDCNYDYDNGDDKDSFAQHIDNSL